MKNIEEIRSNSLQRNYHEYNSIVRNIFQWRCLNEEEIRIEKEKQQRDENLRNVFATPVRLKTMKK